MGGWQPQSMSTNPPARDAKGRLLKGTVLNPKGRPKTGTAFAEAVREHVDPLELIRIALAIARGEPAVQDLQYLRQKAEAEARGEAAPVIEGVGVVWPSMSDRQHALNFLRDSGWQKPTQQVEITHGDDTPKLLDYSKLSDEDLDKLEALHAKAAGVLDVVPGDDSPQGG